MNYFFPEAAADRYSRGRPRFHSNTVSRIAAHLGIQRKLDKALDIACGTGLSTAALLDIAADVYGTDTSEEMLKRAETQGRITYQLAPATQQPFHNGEFNLVTVCSGVHWFDIGQFLAEANRLLAPGGWLVLYDNFFISEMQGVGAFGSWYPEVYLPKFPSPARNNVYDWSAGNLASHNFSLDKEEEFKNHVGFTLDELVLYLTTQSNISAAVSSGKTSYADAEKWLKAELAPFFTGAESRTINFGNWVKYLHAKK